MKEKEGIKSKEEKKKILRSTHNDAFEVLRWEDKSEWIRL